MTTFIVLILTTSMPLAQLDHPEGNGHHLPELEVAFKGTMGYIGDQLPM